MAGLTLLDRLAHRNITPTDLAARYGSGESINSLMKDLGAGFYALKKILLSAGVSLRGNSDPTVLSPRPRHTIPPRFVVSPCEFCGKPRKVFLRSVKRGSRFCSRECMGKSYRVDPNVPGDVPVPCEQCGTVFGSRRTRSGRTRFCSRKCASRHHSAHMAGPANAMRKDRVACVCGACGKAFTKYPSRVSKRRGRDLDFCSRHCAVVHNHQRKEKRTDIELAMAALLSSAGIRFREQVPMYERWVVDFVIDDRRLVVFCDGLYWHRRRRVAAKDKGQNAYLRKCGWNVLRFTNEQILKHPRQCVESIASQLTYSSDSTNV